jgi:hypothetical protein
LRQIKMVVELLALSGQEAIAAVFIARRRRRDPPVTNTGHRRRTQPWHARHA